MKKSVKFFVFAAASVMLAACTHEKNETGLDHLVAARITADVSGLQTRATGATWNADKIGVMTVSASGTMANYKNVGYKTSSTGASATFTPITLGGGIFFEDADDVITFAAYAPYASTANASTLPGSSNDGKIAVNTSSQDTATAQEAIDYLYATGAKASKSSPIVEFKDDYAFKHKMARLVLKVQVSTSDGFSSGDVLNLADYKLGGLIHEGTFDMTSGTAAVNGTAVTDWMLRQCSGESESRKATDNCVASYSNSNGEMTLTMILLPQTLSKALAFSVAPNDGEEQTYSNTAGIQPGLEAGKSYSYTVTVKKTGLEVSGCTITDWTPVTDVAADATM